MRVLHISGGNLYGGIETMLLTLARHRSACPSMVMEVALAFEGRLSAELRAEGVPVHILGAARASRPHTVMHARAELGQLLRGGAFDVAVCHAPWPHAVFGPAVRKGGVPLVFWAHGRANGLHWIEKWASFTVPAMAICNCQFTADAVPAMFGPTPRLVVHYPVAPCRDDSLNREAVRARLFTDSEAVVILQVGRYEAWKGYGELVEALEPLGNRSNWVCWIVGYPQSQKEESYRNRLRDRASDLGIGDRLRFVETREEVRSFFGAADIYCQPNLSPEPFGITLVEAMLGGLPVVTTNLGGPVEFVDEACGVLLPPGDRRGISTALRSLIDDPMLRRSKGEAGRNRAIGLFDPERQLARLADALSHVTAVHAGR